MPGSIDPNLGRRQYDNDHDILIELRTEVRNLIRRIDDSTVERDRVLKEQDERINSLEHAKNRQDGRDESIIVESRKEAQRTSQRISVFIAVGAGVIQLIASGGVVHIINVLAGK